MIHRLSVILALVLVTACSSGGGSDAPANLPPVAGATGPASADEGEVVTLSAAASSDPDGTVQSFTWRQTAGPTAFVSGDFTSVLTVQLPLVEAATDLVFEVAVRDDDGASSSAAHTVRVAPLPRPSEAALLTRHDGELRTYTVYTPASYAPGNPVVMILHGGNGNMRHIFDPARPTERWVELADRDGFLIVSPNGYNEPDQDGLGQEQSWADIRGDESGIISRQDDEGFLLAVLDDVEAFRGFDPDRVFVTGSSNGGMMTFRMLVNQGQRFAAGAAFIGGMPEAFVPLPTTVTPVMILAGTDDPLVLFEGGIVAGRSAPTRSIPDTVDYWLDANLADRSSAVTRTLPDVTADGCLIDETVWTDAAGAPSVTYYQMNGGGHAAPDTTPGLRTPAAFLLIGNQCSDVHGMELADAFFDSVP